MRKDLSGVRQKAMADRAGNIVDGMAHAVRWLRSSRLPTWAALKLELLSISMCSAREMVKDELACRNVNVQVATRHKSRAEVATPKCEGLVHTLGSFREGYPAQCTQPDFSMHADSTQPVVSLRCLTLQETSHAWAQRSSHTASHLSDCSGAN